MGRRIPDRRCRFRRGRRIADAWQREILHRARDTDRRGGRAGARGRDVLLARYLPQQQVVEQPPRDGRRRSRAPAGVLDDHRDRDLRFRDRRKSDVERVIAQVLLDPVGAVFLVPLQADGLRRAGLAPALVGGPGKNTRIPSRSSMMRAEGA